jgi:diguanylate cyclase
MLSFSTGWQKSESMPHTVAHQATTDEAVPVEGKMNDHGVEIFTRRWARTVCDHAVVLQSGAETYGVLEKLVRRFADALVAEPFTSEPGYQIGADLVTAQVATPQALGSTSMLISERLLHDLQLQDRHASGRLAGLLGAMVTGFTTALRDRTFAEQQALVDAVLAIERRGDAVPSDRITGIPKWELMIRRLAEATAASEPEARLGLCLINLDRFKEINASLGPHCGNQVLRAVADRLRTLAAESGHFLAYRGADEFAFVVDGTTCPDDVTRLADQAIETVEGTYAIHNGQRVRIGASAGVVECPAADADPGGLVGAAELALAWAKAERRGRWVVFDPERGAAAAERFALGAAIPEALARGEFTVYYQPLVRLATDDLAGVEALVRWRHPTRGVLAPGQFIDLAERTGLIVPLGAKVLQQACVQAARWRTGGHRPPFVSVNVAAAQLHQPGLPAAVTEVLDTTGLPPRLLQLEITENVLLDPASVDRLDELTGPASLVRSSRRRHR